MTKTRQLKSTSCVIRQVLQLGCKLLLNQAVYNQVLTLLGENATKSCTRINMKSDAAV